MGRVRRRGLVGADGSPRWALRFQKTRSGLCALSVIVNNPLMDYHIRVSVLLWDHKSVLQL